MEIGEADARFGKRIHVRSFCADVVPATHREGRHLRLGYAISVGAHVSPAMVVLPSPRCLSASWLGAMLRGFGLLPIMYGATYQEENQEIGLLGRSLRHFQRMGKAKQR